MASFDEFLAIELRAGTIVEVAPFPEARKPAYQLTIDFGEFGIRKSSAQITTFYRAEELVGTQVMAVTNFPAKRIAGFMSEVLVCGVNDADGNVVLVRPDFPVTNGSRLY